MSNEKVRLVRLQTLEEKTLFHAIQLYNAGTGKEFVSSLGHLLSTVGLMKAHRSVRRKESAS